MNDPVERYEELESRVQMIAAPANQFLSRRTVITVMAAMFLLLGLILAGIVGITTDTNRAVTQQVEPLRERNDDLEGQVADLEGQVAELEDVDAQAIVSLQERNADLEAQIADYDIVVAQAVAAITGMCDQIDASGGACPRVELNPALGMPSSPPLEDPGG